MAKAAEVSFRVFAVIASISSPGGPAHRRAPGAPAVTTRTHKRRRKQVGAALYGSAVATRTLEHMAASVNKKLNNIEIW
jgi:hypothetical protein